jgi:hypothetical protein
VFGEWARGRAVSGAWLAVGPEGGRRMGWRRRRRSRCDEGVVHVHSLKVRVKVRVRIWAWAWARVQMAESARPSEPCLVDARSGRVASARDRSRVADRGRWQVASRPSGHGRPPRPWHARHGPRSVPACHGVGKACRRSGRTRSWPHEQLPGPAGTRRGRCVGPRHPSPRACSRACGCVWVRLRTRRSVRTGFDHPGPGCCGWPCRPQPAIAQSRCHRRSKAAVHHRARPRGYAGLGRSSVRQPTRRALAREPAQHLLNTCTTPRATCPPCSGGASVLATPTAALLNAPGTPPCGARLHGDQASWWSARS